MRIYGITGGTGAGKTTALSVLKEMGAEVIDCDALYYQLLERDQALLKEIEARFPGSVENGKLQRKKLGSQVFADAKARADLNAIVHPHVAAAMDAILAKAAAEGKTLAAVDAIALIESGYAKKCDRMVGVIAPAETRARRIMQRDGISLDYAMQRIQAQQPEEFYRRNCDILLENTFETEAEFAGYCRKRFEELEEQADGRNK